MPKDNLPEHDHSSTGNGGSSIDPDTINGGGVISDGDGIDRQIYIIENGADDPAEADPEDIIIEKEA